MADTWFSNTLADGDPTNLLNWSSDSGKLVSAGQVPQTGDNIFITGADIPTSNFGAVTVARFDTSGVDAGSTMAAAITGSVAIQTGGTLVMGKAGDATSTMAWGGGFQSDVAAIFQGGASTPNGINSSGGSVEFKDSASCGNGVTHTVSTFTVSGAGVSLSCTVNAVVAVSNGSLAGTITGATTVSGGVCTSAITGAVTISGGSCLSAVTGNVTVSGGILKAAGQTITGNVTNSSGNIADDSASSLTITGTLAISGSGSINCTNGSVVTATGGTTLTGSGAVTIGTLAGGTATFASGTSLVSTGILTCVSTFAASSSAAGTINGNCTLASFSVTAGCTFGNVTIVFTAKTGTCNFRLNGVTSPPALTTGGGGANVLGSSFIRGAA